MTRHSRFCLAFALALGGLIADQASKWWMLDKVGIASRPPIEITSFFNLVMVWNKGISFGMFAGQEAAWFLIIMALVIVAVLLVWLARCRERLIAAAIGLIVGGALGNVIDRLRFGAVADFFDFHLMGYHWPAFNIADSLIFIGVVLLCWDSMFRAHSEKKP